MSQQRSIVFRSLEDYAKPFKHKLISLFHRAGLLERRAEKLINLLHAQGVLGRLNSYNFDAGLDYNFTTAKKHQKTAIGCTIAAEIMRTIIQPVRRRLNCLDNC